GLADHAGERAAGDRARESARRRRIAQREGVEVDRVLTEALLHGRLVEVAEDAGLAARAHGGRRAAEQEAELTPADLVAARAAGRRDLGVAVEALAPLVAV